MRQSNVCGGIHLSKVNTLEGLEGISRPIKQHNKGWEHKGTHPSKVNIAEGLEAVSKPLSSTRDGCMKAFVLHLAQIVEDIPMGNDFR